MDTQFELFPPERFMIELIKDVPVFCCDGKIVHIVEAGTQLIATEASPIKYSTEFGEVYIDEAKKV